MAFRHMKSIAVNCVVAIILVTAATGDRVFDVPSVTITNGVLKPVEMPAVGFGTFAYGKCDPTTGCAGGQVWNNTMIVPLVKDFVRKGGRRIDSALSYKTQQGMGAAIADLIADKVVTREELFITSKTDIHPPPPQFANDTGYKYHLYQFEQILNNSGLEYIDLLLVHWPGPIGGTPQTQPLACAEGHPQAGSSKGYSLCRSEAWRAFVTLLKAKKVRAIGVSNFEEKHLEDVQTEFAPGVNQVEFHPFYHENKLASYCRSKGIQFQSYSPLGAYDHMTCHTAGCRNWTLTPLQHQAIVGVAQSHRITPAQAILKWAYQMHGVTNNARTTNPQHMADNLASLDPPMLTAEDLRIIDGVQEVKPAPPQICDGVFCQNKACPETTSIP